MFISDDELDESLRKDTFVTAVLPRVELTQTQIIRVMEIDPHLTIAMIECQCFEDSALCRAVAEIQMLLGIFDVNDRYNFWSAICKCQDLSDEFLIKHKNDINIHISQVCDRRKILNFDVIKYFLPLIPNLSEHISIDIIKARSAEIDWFEVADDIQCAIYKTPYPFIDAELFGIIINQEVTNDNCRDKLGALINLVGTTISMAHVTSMWSVMKRKDIPIDRTDVLCIVHRLTKITMSEFVEDNKNTIRQLIDSSEVTRHAIYKLTPNLSILDVFSGVFNSTEEDIQTVALRNQSNLVEDYIDYCYKYIEMIGWRAMSVDRVISKLPPDFFAELKFRGWL